MELEDTLPVQKNLSMDPVLSQTNHILFIKISVSYYPSIYAYVSKVAPFLRDKVVGEWRRRDYPAPRVGVKNEVIWLNYGLFNDTVSSSDYTSSKYRMLSGHKLEIMWKEAVVA
jgi:hypothetical protein